MTQVISKKSWKRPVALIVAALFIWETVAWAAPAPLIEVLRPEAQGAGKEVSFESLAEKIQIPSSLGSVQEVSASSVVRGLSPVQLVHIEDAHGEPEAQKNSQAILEYLKKEYGIQTFFLEGAWSKLEPSLLRFSNNSEENQKILSELTEKGIVGGPENFLYENYQNKEQGTKNKADGYGIEDLELYKKNLEQFRAVMGAKAESEAFLHEMKSGLITKASQVLNPDLADYFRQWSFQEEVQTDYAAHLRALAEQAQKHLNLDLSDAREQYDWPMLVRFSKLRELEKNKAQGTKDKEKFLGWLNQNLKNYSGCFDSESLFFVPCALSRSDARQFFETFYAVAAPQGFKFKDYPELSKEWGKQILNQELDAPALLREIQSLENKLIEKLAQTADEKKLIEKYREYLLLKKVLSLELSKEEWQQFRTTDQRLPTNDLHAGSVLAAQQRGLTPMVSKLVEQAKLFYETAEKRDEAMFDNTLAWIKKEKIEKAAIITGGFHSEGLSALLKQKNISYVRIQPRITQIHGRENYLKLMMSATSTSEAATSHAEAASNLRSVSLAQPGARELFPQYPVPQVGLKAESARRAAVIQEQVRSEMRADVEFLRGGKYGIKSIDANERLALTDEKGNILIGQSATKEEAHRLGLWHMAAHIYLIDSKGRLLLQRRSQEKASSKGKWQVSASGHVDFGELPIATAVREAEEEIGIRIDSYRLKELTEKNGIPRDYKFDGGLNREFTTSYLYFVTDDEVELIRKSYNLYESDEFVLMPLDYLEEDFRRTPESYSNTLTALFSDAPSRALYEKIKKEALPRSEVRMNWAVSQAIAYVSSVWLVDLIVGQLGHPSLFFDAPDFRLSFYTAAPFAYLFHELGHRLFGWLAGAPFQYRPKFENVFQRWSYLLGGPLANLFLGIAGYIAFFYLPEGLLQKYAYYFAHWNIVSGVGALLPIGSSRGGGLILRLTQPALREWKQGSSRSETRHGWDSAVRQVFEDNYGFTRKTRLLKAWKLAMASKLFRQKLNKAESVAAIQGAIEARQKQLNSRLHYLVAGSLAGVPILEMLRRNEAALNFLETHPNVVIALIVSGVIYASAVFIKVVRLPRKEEELQFLSEELQAHAVEIENVARSFRSESRVLGMRFDDPRHPQLFHLVTFAFSLDLLISVVLRPLLRAYLPDWYPTLFNWLPDFLVPLSMGLIYGVQAHLFSSEAIKQTNVVFRMFKWIEMKPVLWLIETLKVEGVERARRVAFYQPLYIAGLLAFAEVFFPFAHKYFGFTPFGFLPAAYHYGIIFDQMDLLFNGFAAVALFFLNRVGTLRETVEMVKGDAKAIFSSAEIKTEELDRVPNQRSESRSFVPQPVPEWFRYLMQKTPQTREKVRFVIHEPSSEYYTAHAVASVRKDDQGVEWLKLETYSREWPLAWIDWKATEELTLASTQVHGKNYPLPFSHRSEARTAYEQYGELFLERFVDSMEDLAIDPSRQMQLRAKVKNGLRDPFISALFESDHPMYLYKENLFWKEFRPINEDPLDYSLNSLTQVLGKYIDIWFTKKIRRQMAVKLQLASVQNGMRNVRQGILRLGSYLPASMNGKDSKLYRSAEMLGRVTANKLNKYDYGSLLEATEIFREAVSEADAAGVDNEPFESGAADVLRALKSFRHFIETAEAFAKKHKLPFSHRSEMRLIEKGFNLAESVPEEFYDFPIEIVLIADNTGTLTDHLDKPQTKEIRDGLSQILNDSENILIVNSGDPGELVVKSNAELIDRLKKQNALNRWFITADGGTMEGSLDSQGQLQVDKKMSDWPEEVRYQFSVALTNYFYDEILKRLSSGEDFKKMLDINGQEIELDRARALREMETKFKEGKWAIKADGEKKNVGTYLLPQYLGKDAFVYDSGAKLAVDTVGASKYISRLDLEFFEVLEARFKAEVLPSLDSQIERVDVFAGTNFIDLSSQSKVEGVENILKTKVPSAPQNRIRVYVKIGDGVNDLPTLNKTFSTRRNEADLSVFLAPAETRVAHRLGKNVFVSNQAKTGGAEEVIIWLTQISGKTINQLKREGKSSLLLQAWINGRSETRLEKAEVESRFKEVFKDFLPKDANVVFNETDKGVITVWVDVPYKKELFKSFAQTAMQGVRKKFEQIGHELIQESSDSVYRFESKSHAVDDGGFIRGTFIIQPYVTQYSQTPLNSAELRQQFNVSTVVADLAQAATAVKTDVSDLAIPQALLGRLNGLSADKRSSATLGMEQGKEVKVGYLYRLPIEKLIQQIYWNEGRGIREEYLKKHMQLWLEQNGLKWFLNEETYAKLKTSFFATLDEYGLEVRIDRKYLRVSAKDAASLTKGVQALNIFGLSQPQLDDFDRDDLHVAGTVLLKDPIGLFEFWVSQQTGESPPSLVLMRNPDEWRYVYGHFSRLPAIQHQDRKYHVRENSFSRGERVSFNVEPAAGEKKSKKIEPVKFEVRKFNEARKNFVVQIEPQEKAISLKQQAAASAVIQEAMRQLGYTVEIFAPIQRSEARSETRQAPDFFGPIIGAQPEILHTYQNVEVAREEVGLANLLHEIADRVLVWGRLQQGRGNKITYRELANHFFVLMKNDVEHQGRLLTGSEKKKIAQILTDQYAELSLLDQPLDHELRRRLLILVGRKLIEKKKQKDLQAVIHNPQPQQLDRRNLLKLSGMAGLSLFFGSLPTALSSRALFHLYGAEALLRHESIVLTRTKIIANMDITDRRSSLNQAFMYLAHRMKVMENLSDWIRENPDYIGYFLNEEILEKAGRTDLLPPLEGDWIPERKFFTHLPQVDEILQELADLIWNLPQPAIDFLARRYRDEFGVSESYVDLPKEESVLGSHSGGFEKDIQVLRKELSEIEVELYQRRGELESAWQHVVENHQYGFEKIGQAMRDYPALRLEEIAKRKREALVALEEMQFYLTINEQEVSFDLIPKGRLQSGQFNLSGLKNEVQLGAFKNWQSNRSFRDEMEGQTERNLDLRPLFDVDAAGEARSETPSASSGQMRSEQREAPKFKNLVGNGKGLGFLPFLRVWEIFYRGFKTWTALLKKPWPIQIEGYENLWTKDRLILAGNHTGMAENAFFVTELYRLAGRMPFFIAQPEHVDAFTRKLIQMGGGLPIEKGKTVSRAEEFLRNNPGAMLGIFPAGRPERIHEKIKTSAVSQKSTEEIAHDFLHWQESAVARIAVETNTAVVPFAIDSNVPRKWGIKEIWYAFRQWKKSGANNPPFYIKVRIGKPISPKDKSEAEVLENLKNSVVANLKVLAIDPRENPQPLFEDYLHRFSALLAKQPDLAKWSDHDILDFFHANMPAGLKGFPGWAGNLLRIIVEEGAWISTLSADQAKLLAMYANYLKFEYGEGSVADHPFTMPRREFVQMLTGLFGAMTTAGLEGLPGVVVRKVAGLSQKVLDDLPSLIKSLGAERSSLITLGHSTVFKWATAHLGLNSAFRNWGVKNKGLLAELWNYAGEAVIRRPDGSLGEALSEQESFRQNVLFNAWLKDILSGKASQDLPEDLRNKADLVQSIYASAGSLLNLFNRGVDIFNKLSPQAKRGITLYLGKQNKTGGSLNDERYFESEIERIAERRKSAEEKLWRAWFERNPRFQTAAQHVETVSNPDPALVRYLDTEWRKARKTIDQQLGGELRDLEDQQKSTRVARKIIQQVQPYMLSFQQRTLFMGRSEARDGLTRRAWFTMAAGFIGATTFVNAQAPVSVVKAQLFNPAEVNKESLELKKFIGSEADALMREWAASRDKEQQKRVQFIQSVLPTFQKNLWFYSPKNSGAISTSGAVSLRFGSNRLHEMDPETGKSAFQIEFSYDFAKAIRELILNGDDEVKHFARHVLIGGIFMKEMMSLKPMIEHPEYFEILAAAQTRFNNPVFAKLNDDGSIEMAPEALSKDEKEWLITAIGYFNLLFEAEGYVGELDYLTTLYPPEQFISDQKKMVQHLQSLDKAGSARSSHFKERGAPAIFDFLRSRTNRFVEDKKFAEKWSARSHSEKIQVEALRHILAVQQGKGMSLGVTFTQWRVYDALMRRQMDVAWDKKMDFLGSTPEELGLPKSVDELNQKIRSFHGRSEMRTWNAAEARRFYAAAVNLQKLMKQYEPLFKSKRDSANWWKEERGEFASDDSALREKPQPDSLPSSSRGSSGDESLNRKKFQYFSHLEKAINGFLNVTVKTFNPAQSSHGWEGYDQGPHGVFPWRFQPAMQRMGRFAGAEWSKNVDALFDAYQTRDEGTINDKVKGLVILYPQPDKYLGQLPEDLKQLRTTILSELSGAQDDAMLANETKPEQILNRIQEDLGSIGSPLANQFVSHLRAHNGKVLVYDPIQNVNYPLFHEDEFGLLKYYPHSAIAWFERESLTSEPSMRQHLKELNQYAAAFRDWMSFQKKISDYERALLNKSLDAVTFLSVPRFKEDVSAAHKFGALFKENPWRPTIKNILDKAPDSQKFYSLLSGLLPFYLGLSKQDQRYEPLETMQIGMLVDLIGIAPEAAKLSWERSGSSRGPWDIYFEKELRAEMDFSKGDQLISDLLQALELKDKKIILNIAGFGPQTLYDLSVDGRADLNRNAFDAFIVVWGQIQSRSELRLEPLNPYLTDSLRLLEVGDRKMGLSEQQTQRFKDPRNIFIKRHEFKLGNERKSFVASRVRHFHPQDENGKDLPVRGGLRVLMPKDLGKVFDEKLKEIRFTGDDDYDLYLRNRFLERWIQEYAHAMAIQMTLKNLLWGLPRGGAKGVIFLGEWKKVNGEWQLLPTIEKKDDLNSISRIFREVSKIFLVNNVIHESVDGAAPDVNPFTGTVETDRIMEWMVDGTIRVLAQSGKIELVDTESGKVNQAASAELQLQLESIAELDITQTPYLETAILFLQKNSGLAWPVLGRYTGKSVLRAGSKYRTESTGEAAVVIAKEMLRHEMKIFEDKNPLVGQTAAVQGFGAVGIQSVLRLIREGAHVILLGDGGGAIRSKNKSGFTLEEVTEMVDLVRRKQFIIQFAVLHPDRAEILQKEKAGENAVQLRDLGNAELLQSEVDLLFLAALNGQIKPGNAELIRARNVIDIANGGVTPDAANLLAEKSILVAPSILASGGGTAISHQEVLQNEANRYFEMNAVRNRMEADIRDFMNAIYEIMESERRQGRTMDLNEASYVVARQKTLAPLKIQSGRSEMRVFNGYDGVAEEVIKVVAEKQARRKGTGAVLGLGGPSGVGKGFFSKIISGALTRQGYDVHSLEIDGFLNLDAEEVKLRQRAAAQGEVYDAEWDFWDEDEAFNALWLVHDFLNMSFEQPTHPLLLEKLKAAGNTEIDKIEIAIPQAWHRTQKDGSNRYEDKWTLHRDSVVILDGKYIARFEKKFREMKNKRLTDALLVLEDDGDATREKYVHRVYEKYAHQLLASSRLLDEKLNIFDNALVPSYQRYEKETKDVWDYVINVRGLYRPEISDEYPQPIAFQDQDVINPSKLNESAVADLRLFSDFVLGRYPEHYQRVGEAINEKRLLAKMGYAKLPTSAQVMGEILAELYMASRDRSFNPHAFQALFRFSTPPTIDFPALKAAISVYLEGRALPVSELERILDKKDGEQRGKIDRHLAYQLLIAPKLMQYLMYLVKSTKELKTFDYYRDRIVNAWSNLERDALASLKSDGFDMSEDSVGLAYKEKLIQNAMNIVLGNYSSVQYHDGESSARSEMRMPKAGRDSLPALRFFYREILRLHFDMTRASYRPAEEDEQKQAVYDAVAEDLKELQKLLQGHPRIRRQIASRIKSALEMLSVRGTKRNPVAAGTALTQAVEDILNELYEPRVKKESKRIKDRLASKKIFHSKSGPWILRQGVYRNVRVGRRGLISMNQKQGKQFSSLWELTRSLDHQLEKMTAELSQATDVLAVLHDVQDFLEQSAGELPPDLSARLGAALKRMQAQWVVEKQLAAQALQFAVDLDHQEIRSRVMRFAKHGTWLIKMRADELNNMIASVRQLREVDVNGRMLKRNGYFAKSVRSLKVMLERYFGKDGVTWRSPREPRPIQAKIAGMIHDLDQTREPDYEGIIDLMRGIQSDFNHQLKQSSPEMEARLFRYVDAAAGLIEFSDVRHHALFEFEKRKREIQSTAEKADEDSIFQTVFQDLINQRKLRDRGQLPSAWFDLYAFAREPLHLTVKKERVANPRFEALRVVAAILGAKTLQEAINRKKVRSVAGLTAKIKELSGGDLTRTIFSLSGDSRKQLFEFVETAFQLEKKLPLLPAQYRARSEAREFDFVELVQKNFKGQKKLKIIDLGAGSLDFLLDLKQILEPKGYELELHALDESWRYLSDRESAAKNGISLHSAELPYLPIEGPFDIVTVNAPSGILFRELQPAIDGLSDQGFVVWRRSIGTMDGMLERNLLESLDENHYPYIYVSGRFKNLPDGSDTFPLPHLPVVIKKQGASFDPLIWTNEMVRQPARSEARVNKTQPVSNNDRTAVAEASQNLFSIEFVASMSRTEFRLFFDSIFPNLVIDRQKRVRDAALSKAGVTLSINEGLIVGADLAGTEGFWEAAKILFSGQKIAILGEGQSPLENVRFFKDIPAAKQWVNAKKIVAWVSPEEALEHAELRKEVFDWVIMNEQRLAKLYSALGLEAFAQKLMISREFLRAA